MLRISNIWSFHDLIPNEKHFIAWMSKIIDPTASTIAKKSLILFFNHNDNSDESMQWLSDINTYDSLKLFVRITKKKKRKNVTNQFSEDKVTTSRIRL